MGTTDVPASVIDLQCDESKRWEGIISREKTAARRLVRKAANEFEHVPG